MQWLADYWWIILLVLVGMVVSGIKELRRVDVKSYLANKPEIPPHRDNNAQWDDEDDWPKRNDIRALIGALNFSERRSARRACRTMPRPSSAAAVIMQPFQRGVHHALVDCVPDVFLHVQRKIGAAGP